MSYQATFYDAKGAFISSVEGPDEEFVLLNQPEGSRLVSGFFEEDTYLYGGTVLAIPPRPDNAPYLVFDTMAGRWKDERTLEERDNYLGELRLSTVAQINQLRGAAREKFITAIPGQDMVYMEKERAAEAWMAAYGELGEFPPIEDHPLIASEIGLTGEDAYQVAYIYLFKAGQWRFISPYIESICLGHINRAEQGTSEDELNSLPRACEIALNEALQAALSP